MSMIVEFEDYSIVWLILIILCIFHVNRVFSAFQFCMMCFSFDDNSVYSKMLRSFLLMFCFCLPLIYTFIYLVRNVEQAPIYHLHVDWDLSCFHNISSLTHNGTAHNICEKLTDLVPSETKTSLVKITYYFIIMPFAIAVAVNTFLVTKLGELGSLSADSVWDLSLDDELLFVYELCYFFELVFMFLSLVLTAGEGQSFFGLIFFSIVHSVTIFLFVFVSRMEVNESFMRITFLANIFTVVTFVVFWSVVVDWHCTICLVSAFLFTLTGTALTSLHFRSNGNMLAGDLLLCRILIMLPVAIYHAVVLAAGRDYFL